MDILFITKNFEDKVINHKYVLVKKPVNGVSYCLHVRILTTHDRKHIEFKYLVIRQTLIRNELQKPVMIGETIDMDPALFYEESLKYTRIQDMNNYLRLFMDKATQLLPHD
jgi:hypothetical protein